MDKTVSVGYNCLSIGTLAEKEREREREIEKRDFRTRFAQAPRARCDWFAPPFALPFALDIRSHPQVQQSQVPHPVRTQLAPALDQ